MEHRTYIGMNKALRGKTALTRTGDTPGTLVAQFDDTKVVHRHKRLGFGWHKFKVEEFRTA